MTGTNQTVISKLQLGYNRAGRIIEQPEATGIIGPFEGSKAREVLYPDEYSLEQYLETLRNDDTTGVRLVVKPPKFNVEISKAQDNVSKSKPKPIIAKGNTFQTITIPPISKSIPPPPPRNASKIQAYLVVLVLVAIVALMVFFLGGWEGLLKWLS